MRSNKMMGAVCLIGAAALAACQPSQSFDAPAKEAQPLTFEAPRTAPKAATPKSATKKATVSAGAKTPAVTNAVAMDATQANLETRAVAAKQEDETVAATITGCLVMRDDGMFQLKDNDGEHAPKARSWKSGFIKKGSAADRCVRRRQPLKAGIAHRVSRQRVGRFDGSRNAGPVSARDIREV